MCFTKKIHRTDRIHSISYNELYLSFLLAWFPYRCICRICRTKKTHRTDRIHSISYNKCVYTYFKKRCRRERRMAVVERKLHDRKELWLPYLICKNNEFFPWHQATTTTRATQTPQICIFDNEKQYLHVHFSSFDILKTFSFFL